MQITLIQITSKDKKQFNWELSSDYVVATVTDEGEGFNWEEKLNSNKDIICDDERGRGLIMAKMFCNKVFYNEKGNKAFLILESKA